MTPEYLARKTKECEALRREAVVAGGMGRTLHSLGPAVAEELATLVDVRLKSGALARDWAAARGAASDGRSRSPELDPDLAALATILHAFARDAGRRIVEHGDACVRKAGESAGRAAGIEATIEDWRGSLPKPCQPENGSGAASAASPPA